MIVFDIALKDGIKVPCSLVNCDKCGNIAKRIVYGNGTAEERCTGCGYKKFKDQIVPGHTGWEEGGPNEMKIGFINGQIV